MKHRPACAFRLALATLTTCVMSTGALAQEPDMTEVQKNIDIFSGVLAEALDLEQATGLFGISLGGIESTYLYGQGVVLEVRTPLSSRRNTLGLASLTSTLQSMQSRSNPFAALERFDTIESDSPRAMALNAANEAEEFYRSMMERIANVDYSLRLNVALQQASDYARSLRSLESLDEAAYEELRIELDAMRTEMQDAFSELREVESNLQVAAANTVDSVTQTNLQESIDAIMAKLEPLLDRAVVTADELRERSRVAEQEYAARWQQEVSEFETNLYAAMCDYGATLHALPDDEHVSVILTGLGADAEDNRRTNKVHVFTKTDLLQCQNGSIDKDTLEQRSVRYSY